MPISGVPGASGHSPGPSRKAARAGRSCLPSSPPQSGGEPSRQGARRGFAWGAGTRRGAYRTRSRRGIAVSRGRRSPSGSMKSSGVAGGPAPGGAGGRQVRGGGGRRRVRGGRRPLAADRAGAGRRLRAAAARGGLPEFFTALVLGSAACPTARGWLRRKFAQRLPRAVAWGGRCC